MAFVDNIADHVGPHHISSFSPLKLHIFNNIFTFIKISLKEELNSTLQI